MFEVPSFRIGKILGIPFEVNLSWIIIFVIVALALATSYYPGVLPAGQQASLWLLAGLGAATAFLFFASILAHEISHAVVAKMQGGNVEKITLFIFGGIAQIGEEPASPGRELLMASAGPGMSIFLAGLSYLGWVLTVGSAPWWVSSPLDYLAQINLFVGLFNLLPGFPLDGGRVLHSILWAVSGDSSRSRRWAARSGQVIGWSIAVAALLAVLMGNAEWIWVGLVGWFIAWLAGTSYKQEALRSRLAGLTMEQVMTLHPEYVDGGITVDSLVHEHLLGRQHSRYPVMENGAIIGVVSLADVKALPREQWFCVRVADITDRALDKLSVDVATTVTAVLPRFATDRPGALLVVRAGHLVGIVTKSDIIGVMNEQPPT